MAAWASQRPGDLFRVTRLLDVISILCVCVYTRGQSVPDRFGMRKRNEQRARDHRAAHQVKPALRKRLVALSQFLIRHWFLRVSIRKR